jgi:hypothetical protein
MKATTVKISTTSQADNTVLRTSFIYNIPESITEALTAFGEEQTYELFKSALVIALQAPARKQLQDIWEEIPYDTRITLAVAPEKEGASSVADLANGYQASLQTEMDNWLPGQKSTRARAVKPEDAVSVLIGKWDTLPAERQAELMTMMAEKFPGIARKR